MFAKNLDAKHEKIVRELVKESSNRRCVNCDSLGPQYAVMSFNVFVCTPCSGVHRQFGHRVKGISMSTFKAEEVAALQEGGNAKFLSNYCQTWSTSALPKPVDRQPESVKAWIEAVYVAQRFVGEGATRSDEDKGNIGGAEENSSQISDQEKIAESLGEIKPLSDVIGRSALSLQVGPLVAAASAPSAASDEPPQTHVVSQVVEENASEQSNIKEGEIQWLDVASADVSDVPVPAWDPFGDSGNVPGDGDALHAPFGSSGPNPIEISISAPAHTVDPVLHTTIGADEPGEEVVEAGWAAFDDDTHVVGQVEVSEQNEWQAFADNQPQDPAQNNVATTDINGSYGSYVDNTARNNGHSLAESTESLASGSVLEKEKRKEVPLDLFYPEFEQIRATGLLPTGKPLPAPLLPPQLVAGAQVQLFQHEQSRHQQLDQGYLSPYTSVYNQGEFHVHPEQSLAVNASPVQYQYEQQPPVNAQSPFPISFGSTTAPLPQVNVGVLDNFAPKLQESLPFASAGTTLFGDQPTLTGYNLAAPAAPKPADGGNPFA